jgi:hypothetical protein
MNDEHLTKVRFELDDEDWHGRPSETLWAEPVAGATVGVYRLRNSPFFMRGVSYQDIVRAVPSVDHLGLAFAGAIDHSGHSTYMLLVPPDSREFATYWERLSKRGCTFESMHISVSLGPRILYSVDVPASSNVHAVYAVLEEGERNHVWVFQEGHFGHTPKEA